ncbi:uncharacterized protein LOC142768296 [Rhipicephalus microplus]|uniref:uncharacterized protein LOC142768296 n=1 Tax=Rhipicephalus microplus TaxID=6941 RepID=UPI003F6D0982
MISAVAAEEAARLVCQKSTIVAAFTCRASEILSSSQILSLSFTPWKKVKGNLLLQIFVDEKGGARRHMLRINPFGNRPSRVDKEYMVLHADANCIIIIVEERTRDCVFWTKESLVGTDLLECDFVFKYNCNMPVKVTESLEECK